MRHWLLLMALLLLTACSSGPAPTPFPLQQYPVTWTPAPTPTNTPPGPTATLVIQRTPFAFPTRDPNARLLPTVPRGTTGVWADVSGKPSPGNQAFAGRAQILVSHESRRTPRKNNQFLLLQIAGAPDITALTPEFNGIVLAPETKLTTQEIAALRKTLSPRLVLASASVTDTARLDTILPAADGVLLEHFLRSTGAPPDQFPAESAWNHDIETLAKLSASPDTIVLTAFASGDGNAQNLPQEEQWANYALASFLLAANNSHTFFGVTGDQAPNMLLPELERQLGAPIGGIFKQNGVYQRRFAGGLALVNPTDAKHAFYLPRKYRDGNGSVISQIETQPHTGVILQLE